MCNCKLPNNLFRLSLEIVMWTSPVPEAVKNCEVPKCFDASTAPLSQVWFSCFTQISFRKCPRLSCSCFIFNLLCSMFTVFSKGLSAGAGGVCFQPQYSSDTLLAFLSRTPKGEQRRAKSCFACTSPKSLRAFLEAVLCKMSGPAVFPLLFPWQVSIHPYFT